ncbi:MAG: ribosomal protein S18-alanine N-acetyltransferase [Caldilineaceae bacterium]|nr:ribosomal protein S18-alanine N-acetyltransferase [Caldilineaceae bacterium]
MVTPPTEFSPMTLDDVPVVGQMEKLCFSAPWSADTYRNELAYNRRAHYWVLRPARRLREEGAPPILAYGGYWLLGDEAHIVTIATHPDYRRQGLAELLLRYMIRRVEAAGVTDITLEVRVSNSAARQLYEKMGFVKVGLRKRYYSNNGEDALLLTLFLPGDAEEGVADGA